MCMFGLKSHLVGIVRVGLFARALAHVLRKGPGLRQKLQFSLKAVCGSSLMAHTGFLVSKATSMESPAFGGLLGLLFHLPLLHVSKPDCPLGTLYVVEICFGWIPGA